MKIHKEATLMKWKKEDLVRQILILEHSNTVLEENFENQYDNFIKLLYEMKIVNDAYKNKFKKQQNRDEEG